MVYLDSYTLKIAFENRTFRRKMTKMRNFGKIFEYSCGQTRPDQDLKLNLSSRRIQKEEDGIFDNFHFSKEKADMGVT